MYKGIYIALSGAILKHKHMDIFAQNIANVNTTGYKKQRISFKDYLVPSDIPSQAYGEGRVMVTLSGISIDFTQGPLIPTGNPLDFAISGSGFFALEGNKYTRNGRFMLDAEGNLITPDGLKVLGDGGPITLHGSEIEVSDTGEILVDGVSVGRFRIVDFPDRNVLKKVSGGVYYSDAGGEDVNSGVRQGYIEGSNVNPVQELIQMIETTREFETYQKMIQAFDEATSKTVNEMGR